MVRQARPLSTHNLQLERLEWLMIVKPSPGRFSAAAVMKVMLAQIILNYDCALVALIRCFRVSPHLDFKKRLDHPLAANPFEKENGINQLLSP